METWSDIELIERVLNKDPRGWPEMLRRFEKLIWFGIKKFGRGISDDDRDELYQDVMCALLRDDMHALRVYDPSRAKLSSYVLLHTRWTIGKYRERAKRVPVQVDDGGDDARGLLAERLLSERDQAVESTVVDDLITQGHKERLSVLLTRVTLTEKDRQFVDLHYRQGLTPTQVASQLGVSHQRISQRRDALEQRLIAASRDPAIGNWTPWDYESAAVRDLRDRLPRHRRVLAVGPTGCGKTVIAAMLMAQEVEWRVLFVVHRYEMADQAFRALRSHGIQAGIVMAQDEVLHGRSRANPNARVQVASVQTLCRRRKKWARIDLIVFDEAHRVMADSYQRVAGAYPNAMCLGLTATPERGDAKGLGDFFADMLIIAQPSQLQRQRHLASPRWFGARADVVERITERLRGARTKDGDYAPRDLARAVDSKFLTGEVVSETLRIAPSVSKVVFAGSIDHSKRLADKFTQHGIKAAHLDGATPPRERRSLLHKLAKGKIEVICNYDVLGEGWDLPNLGAVILARPFRSRSKYLQVIGRGMRWREGEQPIVIDHGNNAPRLGVWPGDDVDWRLEGTRRSSQGEPPWKQCEACLQKIQAGATVCGNCGHACPIGRAKIEREEIEARLEEQTRAEYLALRTRVAEVGKKKGAPDEWVERVMGEAG